MVVIILDNLSFSSNKYLCKYGFNSSHRFLNGTSGRNTANGPGVKFIGTVKMVEQKRCAIAEVQAATQLRP